jgi:hypothetical protein
MPHNKPLLIAEPGDEYNTMGYYFSLIKFKRNDVTITQMESKEKIRKVLKEDINQVPDNFNKIPVGTNNYRSAQFTSPDQLKSTINKYNIKHVVRLNPETEEGGIDAQTEKSICNKNGCSFSIIPSQEKINSLLNQGNTLIHCKKGKDRTGGAVGGFLLTKGWNTKQIWDYTVQYNDWVGELKGTVSCPNNCWGDNPEGRHLISAKKFGVKNREHALQLTGIKRLKESIKKVLKEGVKERIIELIDSLGLESAISFVGGWEELKDIVGEEYITTKHMIGFIKEVTRKAGGLSVFDFDKDPIFYEETKSEYREITYFGPTRVTVQRWYKETFDHLGDLYIFYEKLGDDVIKRIFEFLIDKTI